MSRPLNLSAPLLSSISLAEQDEICKLPDVVFAANFKTSRYSELFSGDRDNSGKKGPPLRKGGEAKFAIVKQLPCLLARRGNETIWLFLFPLRP